MITKTKQQKTDKESIEEFRGSGKRTQIKEAVTWEELVGEK